MAYQPNPFVNPEQRGVELPPGCKDLYEVLEKAEAQSREPESLGQIEHGTLTDLPRHVQRFYMEAAGLLLV